LLRVRSPDSEEPFYEPDEAVPKLGFGDLAMLDVLEILPSDATRLAPRLTNDFPGAARRVSSLEIVPLVDGERWTPPEELHPLRESELRWLIRPVLAVAAFQGAARGTGTQSFRKAVGRLRSARIYDAQDIRIKLLQHDQTLSDARASSWWDENNRVLIVDRSESDWFESLGEPLGRALERADLDIPLRLLLVGLSHAPQPTDEQIQAALIPLGIDAQDYRVATEAFSDEIGWILLRIRPAVRLLAPTVDDAVLDRIDSLEELVSILNASASLPIPAAELLDLCRSATTDRDLGTMLLERLGEVCQLDRWNDALAALGPPYEVLQSDAVKEDFETHALAARSALRTAVREVARRSGDPMIYPQLRSAMESVACPSDWSARFWSLSFTQVCTVLADVLEAAGGLPTLLQAVRVAED
jgi:hypothetical protein